MWLEEDLGPNGSPVGLSFGPVSVRNTGIIKMQLMYVKTTKCTSTLLFMQFKMRENTTTVYNQAANSNCSRCKKCGYPGMSSTENLFNWRVFHEVVKQGGIIAAAEALECEPSTVSRTVKKLEKDLGAPLFLRASRPLELTDLGRLAHERSGDLLGHYDEMMSEMRGDRERLAVVIRLAAHAGMGPI